MVLTVGNSFDVLDVFKSVDAGCDITRDCDDNAECLLDSKTEPTRLPVPQRVLRRRPHLRGRRGGLQHHRQLRKARRVSAGPWRRWLPLWMRQSQGNFFYKLFFSRFLIKTWWTLNRDSKVTGSTVTLRPLAGKSLPSATPTPRACQPPVRDKVRITCASARKTTWATATFANVSFYPVLKDSSTAKTADFQPSWPSRPKKFCGSNNKLFHAYKIYLWQKLIRPTFYLIKLLKFSLFYKSVPKFYLVKFFFLNFDEMFISCGQISYIL